VILAAAGLILNAAVSLLGAWALCALLARAISRPAWAKWALALPFAKVALDLARGIGPGAYVRSPYADTRWELGRFRFGVSLTRPLLPALDGALDARVGDTWYTLSLGDLLVKGLRKVMSPGWLGAIVAAVLVVSLALAARRVVAAIRFERARRRDRLGARSIARVRVGRREVDVYASDAFGGAPFAGGLLRPYVCFPAEALALLGEEERQAALAHEIGHVRALDAPLFFAFGLMADLAWFVPGARRLLGAARAESERAADEAAVRAGADPVRLASAIARLCEHGAAPAGAVPLTGRARRIARRIEALVTRAPAEPRWRTALRVLAAAALAHAAIFSNFLTHR
jgi:Zn-dependent protease with chaperone function